MAGNEQEVVIHCRFHTAHLWNTDEQMYFEQYMKSKAVDAIMDGSNRTHTTGSSYKLVDGVVRIDQGTMCRNNGDVYRDLMSVSPSRGVLYSGMSIC